jgi:glycosyltransferase involved in cell wall biosynthesis
MKILALHNYYQRPGGEDRVFASEAALLEAHGHSVIRISESNQSIGSGGFKAAGQAVWNHASLQKVRRAVQQHKPDLIHAHNTFPLLSPSIYFAGREANVPVVQTLHNYRLLCPGATLMRDGAPCEECLSKRSVFPAIRHACYRSSVPATAAVAAMLTVHRAAGTWQRAVDFYIALSAFSKTRFVEGGLPAERIAVKQNFIDNDPPAGDGSGGYALFVGRLSEEKGVGTLQAAWEYDSALPLTVAGDGPLQGDPWPPGVTAVGYQPHDKVLELMRSAAMLIFPSVWYECNPMTILEAFACGLPVIASDLGAMRELVDHGRTGLLFRPGDAQDLARTVRWAVEHPAELAAMRIEARREYEAKYTPERNYAMLMDIYRAAMERAQERKRKAS